MPYKQPKWLTAKLETPTTRSRSGKQESRLAKQLKGQTTINSGATLGQNDVILDFAEIEAKVTGKRSFTFKLDDWEKLQGKCNVHKVPMYVILFDGEKPEQEFALIRKSDLQFLIETANAS